MKILALDSATTACSVALWAEGTVLASESIVQDRGQAEALLPMVERVRAKAGLDLSAVDRLAVTVGPGHFTGLRAGLATARGLALALGRPLIGITTLQAVAAGVSAAERAGASLVVALDSKRAEAYFQVFDEQLQPQTAPVARQPEEFAADLLARGALRYVIAGDAGAPLLVALRNAGVVLALATAAPRPDAAIVAALAALAPLEDGPPRPLYLHAPETTAPRRAPSVP